LSKMCGFIYIVENRFNQKLYVGQTTDLSKREEAHLYGYSRCPALNNAIKKYDKENFDFVILERCSSQEDLNEREIYWIRELNTVAPNGYNLKEGGQCGGKLSEETKEKISNSNLGSTHTREAKRKISEASKGNNHALGYKHTEEARVRISQALKGRKFSDEHRRKLSLSNTGKSPSESALKKMSMVQKGKTIPQEVREKISKSLKGRKAWFSELPKEQHPRFGKRHSEETKRKISLSKKGVV